MYVFLTLDRKNYGSYNSAGSNVPQKVSPNVNLSYCLNLMILGPKFKKFVVGHFFNTLKGYSKVIQAIITKIVTFDFHVEI